MDYQATNGSGAMSPTNWVDMSDEEKTTWLEKRFPEPQEKKRERTRIEFRDALRSLPVADQLVRLTQLSIACQRAGVLENPDVVNFEALQLICDEQREINRRQSDEIISLEEKLRTVEARDISRMIDEMSATMCKHIDEAVALLGADVELKCQRVAEASIAEQKALVAVRDRVAGLRTRVTELSSGEHPDWLIVRGETGN
jgi:hypothetical protein